MLGNIFNRLRTIALTPATDADAFLRLVKRGDVDAVRAQLAAGLSPDTANSEGETAAHIAARENRAEIVAVLAAAGANMRAEIKGQSGRTPLHDAINFGKSAAAVALVSCGGYPADDGQMQDLIHRACEKDMTDVISALVAAGFDLCQPSGRKLTPMIVALNARKTAVARQLVTVREVAAGLNVPMPGDREGCTVFHLAVTRGDEDLVLDMLDTGAFINHPRDDGMSPLLLAIQRGDAALVAALIGRGADVMNPMVRDGRQLQPAPLFYLAGLRTLDEKSRAAIALHLIEAGAEVNAVDAVTGEAPLHRLMQSQKINAALAVLLKAGAKVNLRNREGATPLMLAIECATIHEVSNLLSAGADANARHRQDARTPLMIAAALGLEEAVSELLQARANPRLLDQHGHSAFYYAQVNLRQREKTEPLLLEALRRDTKPLFRGSAGTGRAP